MAVVASKKNTEQNDLIVLRLAKELALHSIGLCSNENHFPKRYRWCLTSKIVDSALNVVSNIRMGNSVKVEAVEDYIARKTLQDSAYGYLMTMHDLIDICKMDNSEKFNICGKSLDHWLDLIDNVENLLQKWMRNDYKRYSQVFYLSDELTKAQEETKDE